MATKTKKKPKGARKPKAKQGYLDPEMQPVVIQAIEDAASNYYDVMQDRVKLSEEEDELKDALIDVMNKEKLARYEMEDGRVVMLTDKLSVKVKKTKKPTDGGVENEFIEETE